MKIEELSTVLADHVKWLRGEGGARADLSGARLAGANLNGARLTGADLEGEILDKNPIFLTGLRWPVLITAACMRIGCERHTHEAWAELDDDAISGMEDDALAFWSKHRDMLLALCHAHRGEK